MHRALELAQNGLGQVAPNPMVGCVIVYKDIIIAEGFHQQYGEAHAEVNAIANLSNTIDTKECTVYVTLEPCSHFGKTPPCADLLMAHHFKTIVVGCLDINPLVAGKGIEKLQAAGIEVITGVLEQECIALNKRFFTFHQKKRPYIILKWAQTADGFISKLPVPINKAENWISSEASKTLVHQWRANEASILVGKNTVLADNPELTVRFVSGNNPLRLVIDKNIELPITSAVFSKKAFTIVYNSKKETSEGNVWYKQLDFEANVVSQILDDLWSRNITSLIIEGGTIVLNQFIEQNKWDEAQVFINPHLSFENGVAAPKFEPLFQKTKHLEELHSFFNEKSS
jgi:diaminohydroxyphosphoribosylaminopyrimidine deaminase / 5-amino-6-(5-phosphoribosylamino)uracil reductase